VCGVIQNLSENHGARLINMTDEKRSMIEQILNRFLDVNQEVFNEVEELDLTTESVEVILSPLERRIMVRLRGYKNNTLQTYRADKNLVMKNVDFDANLKRQLSPGAILRGTDMRNLDPQTLEKVLTDIENNQPTE